jgi:hypothetical protein
MAEDLVSCLICGHSAQTLARHLKASHGITADVYREQHPGARIRSEACEANRRAAIAQAHADKPRKGLKKTVVCPCGLSYEVGATSASKDLRCSVCRARDKAAQPPPPPRVSPLKGRKLPEDVRLRMSANAGRWNAGLTKDTDERVKAISDHRRGQPSWSKGLTKDSHPSLLSTSEKLSALKTGQACTNGLKADLSEIDFTPYLDATGAVDRKTMAEELHLSEITVFKYMESLGLRLSNERMAARVERDLESGRFFEMSRKSAEVTRVILTAEQLEPYRQVNGKVVLAHAMRGLGHTATTIRKECIRLGLPVRVHATRQILCLEAIKGVLGGAPYEMEWRSMRFVNPPTGHQFRFDGYFPSHALVVEFMGYQHWTFPSVFIKQREIFDALVERDRVKARLIRESGDLHYLELREDEPYTDERYLRERLLDVLPV